MAGVGGLAGVREQVQVWPITRFRPYDRNPRKNDHAVERVAAAIREFGFRVPLLARSNGDLIDGHLRLKAAALIGLVDVPVLIADDLSDAQVRAFRISVNRMAELAEWDHELLAAELGELEALEVPTELAGWTAEELEEAEVEAEKPSELDGETYTRKIKVPIYEPRGDRPAVSQLLDDTKTQELVREIDAAGLPDDVATFLRRAAERHTVFHFRNIAEFYAHADAKTQDLMERSALVIIDFDKAIEYGFVRMTERLGALADTEGWKDA